MLLCLQNISENLETQNTALFMLQYVQILNFSLKSNAFCSSELFSNPVSIYEELVSKTPYIHPDMLLICIIDFLLQLK